MSERLRQLSEMVCEPNWVLLDPSHEEHAGQRFVAIMSAECRMVHVHPQRSYESRADTEASAMALRDLLNLAATGKE